MMISVECPHCGADFRADEQRIGATAKCPMCRKEFIVPRPVEQRPLEQVPPVQPAMPIVVQTAPEPQGRPIGALPWWAGLVQFVTWIAFGLWAVRASVMLMPEVGTITQLAIHERNSTTLVLLPFVGIVTAYLLARTVQHVTDLTRG